LKFEREIVGYLIWINWKKTSQSQ